MKNTILLFSIVLMNSFSCNNGVKVDSITNVNNSKYSIETPKNDDFFNIDSIFTLESVIPLESSENTAIGVLFKGIVHADVFYMHDFINHNLFVFDSNGKFKYKIGRKGKGPNEYLELRDFMINGNYIYTLDYKKIHRYSVNDGKYQNTINLNISEFNPLQLIAFDENNYYVWQSNPGPLDEESKKDKYRLIRVKNGKIFAKYFRYTNECFDDQRFFLCCNGKYYIKPVLGDYTVYTITKDSLSPSFSIDFGNRLLPSDYFKEKNNNLNDCLKNSYFKSPRKVYDMNDFIYFNNIGPGSYLYEGLINKQSKQVYYGREDSKCNPEIFYSDGDCIYGYYEPSALFEPDGCKSCKIFQTVKNELNKRINLYDNIIVVKLTLKK